MRRPGANPQSNTVGKPGQKAITQLILFLRSSRVRRQRVQKRPCAGSYLAEQLKSGLFRLARLGRKNPPPGTDPGVIPHIPGPHPGMIFQNEVGGRGSKEVPALLLALLTVKTTEQTLSLSQCHTTHRQEPNIVFVAPPPVSAQNGEPQATAT